MRYANDGLPFHIDNIGDNFTPNDVEVIQFLRPNGKRRRMLVEVGEEYVQKSLDMILSCEELTTREIAIYARFIGEEQETGERLQIAINGPGEREPTKVLKELIDQKCLERK